MNGARPIYLTPFGLYTRYILAAYLRQTMMVIAALMTIALTIDLWPQVPLFSGDPLQVRIVGHRFWWEVRYPKYNIITANEIHVPVSYLSAQRPVELTLASADVVHGFWVPELNGKEWLVPDRENKWWIQPTSLGIFLGNCTVLCGPQQHEQHDPHRIHGSGALGQLGSH